MLLQMEATFIYFFFFFFLLWLSVLGVKNLPAMQETQEIEFQSLVWEDLLEEDIATHSSILA